jgi:hypothetical protein
MQKIPKIFTKIITAKILRLDYTKTPTTSDDLQF